MIKLIIFLQAAQQPSLLSSLLPFLLIFVVLYFFMLRPQVKKQKEQTKFVAEIQKGIEVVTNSGLIGRINKIEGEIITLQIDPKTFIRVLKGTISKELTESYNKAQAATGASAEKSEA